MKDCIYHFVLAVAALSAAVACTYRDEVPSPVSTVSFTASQAVYDDLSGDFSLVIGNDSEGLVMELRLGSQPDKVSRQVPLPETGLYTIGASDVGFRILDGSQITDSSGVQTLEEASISVSSDGNTCKISGTVVYGSGTPLRFDASGISFSHSSSSSMDFEDAKGQYDGHKFLIRLSGGQSALEMTFLTTGGTADAPVLPDGNYSTAHGNISDCSYTDGSSNVPVGELVCEVSREKGGYVISGAFSAEDGGPVRFYYEGLVFRPEPEENLYLTLGGQWDMRTDSWLVYNTETKVWEESSEGDGFSVTVSGLPDYSSFLVEDLFEADFAMLIENTGDGLSIPSSALDNPVALVHASTGSFVLFPALYSIEAGLFLSEGNDIPVSLSEDRSLMNIPTVEADGVVYNYFGLIGRSTSGGSYSMFSNWSFIMTPDFVAAASENEASSSSFGLTAIKADGLHRSVVSGIILPEDIISIEPIKR